MDAALELIQEDEEPEKPTLLTECEDCNHTVLVQKLTGPIEEFVYYDSIGTIKILHECPNCRGYDYD